MSILNAVRSWLAKRDEVEREKHAEKHAFDADGASGLIPANARSVLAPKTIRCCSPYNARR